MKRSVPLRRTPMPPGRPPQGSRAPSRKPMRRTAMKAKPEVHGHPTRSELLGHIVPSWERPEDVPVLLWDGRLVDLTEDGGYAETSIQQEEA